MLYTILFCVLSLETAMAHTTVLFITRLAGQPCLKKGMVIGRSLFTKRSLGYFHYISPLSLAGIVIPSIPAPRAGFHYICLMSTLNWVRQLSVIRHPTFGMRRLCSFISLREFSNVISCTIDFSCSDCND